MFEQPTNNQSNLQQPRNDLQQNAPSLQQGSTSTQGSESVNPTNILSQPTGTQQLKVLTQSQANGPASSAVNTDQGTHVLLLALLLIPVIIVVAAFWPRKAPTEEKVEIVEPVIPKKASTEKTPKKSTKKKISKHRPAKKR